MSVTDRSRRPKYVDQTHKDQPHCTAAAAAADRTLIAPGTARTLHSLALQEAANAEEAATVASGTHHTRILELKASVVVRTPSPQPHLRLRPSQPPRLRHLQTFPDLPQPLDPHPGRLDRLRIRGNTRSSTDPSGDKCHVHNYY